MTGKQPFETVVAQHGNAVLRVCRSVVGAVDADDAWSETFLSAMKEAYPDLPVNANVQAWLVTIAHRKAIDLARGAARRAVPVADTPDTADTSDHDQHQHQHEHEHEHDDLIAALTALPVKQKQAVTYHYLAGLAFSEVAAILGGTTDAARRSAADGIATLRRTYLRVDTQRSIPMTSLDNADDFTPLLTRAFPARPDHLARLHQKLAVVAQAEGLLDIAYRTLDTPVGPLLLAATDVGLVRVAYAVEDHDTVLQHLSERISPRILHAPARLEGAVRELDEYFTGHRTDFDLPLDWRLSVGFRTVVLQHLSQIAYGHTASYAAVAGLAGHPKAARAVGTACATNPLPVVVPCHRVVRADGSMGGYLGGADAKRTLLTLESAA